VTSGTGETSHPTLEGSRERAGGKKTWQRERKKDDDHDDDKPDVQTGIQTTRVIDLLSVCCCCYTELSRENE
jgi:hypothetical protein